MTDGGQSGAPRSAAARGVAWLRLQLRDLGGQPLLVVGVSCTVLILSHYQGSTNFFRQVFGADTVKHAAAGALPFFWWFGASLFLYLIVPVAVSAATRSPFVRGYGFGLGDWRAGLRISLLFLAVMLPAVYVASKWKAFAGHYPLAGQAAFTLKVAGKDQISVPLFVAYEAAYFLYFVGWEFLFRGYMLNGLLPRFGRGGAILFQTAPFAIMHLGKPEPEALGSIVAGIALGILALRTRSFWYGALLHGAIAVWMDVLSAWSYLHRT